MDTRGWSWLMVVLGLRLAGCASGMPAEAEGGARPGTQLYDPFAGEMPQPMADALAAQEQGDLLEIDVQRWLFEYAQRQTGDAPPWLILARDSMAREWGGIAVRQYDSALRADDRVTKTPFILADLVEVTARFIGSDEEEARALIVHYWGASAIPRVERALSEAQAAADEAALERLSVLLDSLDTEKRQKTAERAIGQ